MPGTTDPASAALTLHLQANPCVATPQGRRIPLERRAAALCALAALEPGFSRERAAAWLWPDAPDARHNLRQQLLRFRTRLGSALVEGQFGLRLAPGVTLQTEGGADWLAGEPAAEDDFGLWLARQREAARRARREPVRQALALAEQAQDLDLALQHALALVAQDHAEEAHHVALMRVHYLRGESAAGLAAHERLVQTLQALYGAEPAPATQQLAQALRRGASSTPATPATPATQAAVLALVFKRPPLLVGRAVERAAIAQAWVDGRAVLLEGEAGMGKSRLIAEMTQGQADVWIGAGRPGDRGAPYATLARLLGARHSQLATVGAEARLSLSRLLPTTVVAEVAEPLRPGAMAAAMAELLQAAGARTLVLDDLHFADTATIELLTGLAAAADGRLHWLFAQRPAEASGAAGALHDALLEQQRLVRVDLQPLDESAAMALVAALDIPGLNSLGLGALLVRHTGGNPLYMLETLKQGLVDGSLVRGELPRPVSVDALIEHRLQRLSEAALNLARVAAIAGVDFSIELAEAAIGQSAVQLSSAWHEAQQAQILRGEAFAHDMVADAALRSVPPVVARRLHAQCGAWLAARGGDPARTAVHWQQAGHAAQAAAAFEQAAARALAASRRSEEAALQGQAAAQWALAGQSQQRFECLALRVEALTSAALDETAIAEAAALQAAAVNDAQRVRAIRVHMDMLSQQGQYELAQEIALPGLALAKRIDDQAEYVRIAGPLSGNLCKLGRPDEAYALLLPLREWVDGQIDDEIRWLWFGYWGMALSHMGRMRESAASHDIAIAALERVGRRDALGSLVLNLGVVLRTEGRLARALETSRHGLVLMSDDPGQTSNRVLARLMHARNEAESGLFAPAQQALEEILPALDAMGSPFWPCAARTQLATLWLHLGQHARALQALQAGDADTPAWMRAGRCLLRLEIADWMGQPMPQGQASAAVAMVQADRYRLPGIAVRALRAAAPTVVLAQAAEWAAVSREQERFGVALALAVFESRAALALGDADSAVAATRVALALLADGYAPEAMYLPEVHWVAWRALHAGGLADEATAVLQAGVDWVRRQALPQVPAAYIESFLHRNPVNRALLAAASK